MNRPIKFRAWDKLNKKMFYKGFAIRAIGQDHTDGGVFFEKGKGDIGAQKKYNPFEIEYMQFTGLLDKNGKEIYEGDIVKSDDGSMGEIAWDNLYANYRNHYRKGNCCLCRDMPFPLWHSFHKKGTTEFKPTIEVIGNIWENPDLLK